MRALATLVALLALSSAAHAAETAERFDYNVEWGFADVARVTMQRGCTTGHYRAASLTAKSLGVIDQVHSFDIRLDSFTNSSRTLEGRTAIMENGVARSYNTRFAADGSATSARKIRKSSTKLSLSLRPNTYDLLSWFTALRDLPLSQSTVKKFQVWDGWKLTEITAVGGKLERVWTPSGTFRARRFDVSRIRLRHSDMQPQGKRESVGVVWLTTDGNLPVAFDFKAPVGTAKVRLTRSTRQTCTQ